MAPSARTIGRLLALLTQSLPHPKKPKQETGPPMKRLDRSGFTFVEALTALALMTVLTVLVLGRFSKTREYALRATLMSDLRNLTTAQELYWRLNYAYSPSVGPLNVNPSATSAIYITEATASGWAAWNEVEGTLFQCELYFGNGVSSPLGYAPSSERIACGTP